MNNLKSAAIGHHVFYGLTTLGEKGQAVVPAEARRALKIKTGEKLLVLGVGQDMLLFSKLSNLEIFAADLSKKLAVIKKMIKKNGRR